MQEMLRNAANALQISDKHAFTMSVTEEEIHNGVFNNPNVNGQTLYIQRDVVDKDQFPPAVKKRFVDTLDDGSNDCNAAMHLEQLKKDLTAVFSSTNTLDSQSNSPATAVLNITTSAHIVMEAQTNTAEVQYIHTLSNNVCSWLWGQISNAYGKRRSFPPLFTEVAQHLEFMSDKLAQYTPVVEAQERIVKFLEDPDTDLTFVLHAESGAGKTSLVAWAAQHAIQHEIHTIVRFLGTSPQSSDVVSLLKSICNQLHELFVSAGGALEADTEVKYEELLHSGTHMQLSELMQKLLENLSALECRVCLFLDSLDQLLPWSSAHALNWLPLKSFRGIKILVSTLIPTPEQQATANLFTRLERLYSAHTKSRNSHEWSIGLQAMSQSGASSVLDKFISVHPAGNQANEQRRRTLTAAQKSFALSEFSKAPTPLFLRVVCDLASSWTSNDVGFYHYLKVIDLLSLSLFSIINSCITGRHHWK